MTRLYSIPPLLIEEPLCISFELSEDVIGTEIDVSALCLPESQIINNKTDFVFWNSELRLDYKTRKVVSFEKSSNLNWRRWKENTIPASTDLAVRCYDSAWIMEEESDYLYLCGLVEFETYKIDNSIHYVKFVLSVFNNAQANRKYTFMDGSTLKATLRKAKNGDVIYEHVIDLKDNRNDAGSFFCLRRDPDNSFAIYRDEDFVQGGLIEYLNQYC